MNKIIIVILITLFPLVTIAQTNPCKDKRYLELQKKNIDSLSQSEYIYFSEKTKECDEYKKSQGDSVGLKIVPLVLAIIAGILITLGFIATAQK